MGVAWLVTLPCAAVVGALTSYVAVRGGVAGTVVVIIALAVGALLIIRQANHNKVDFSNVNDAHEVVVAKRTDPSLGRPPRTLQEVKAEFATAPGLAVTSPSAPVPSTSATARRSQREHVA